MWGHPSHMGSQLQCDYHRAVSSGTVGNWAESADRQLGQALAILRTLRRIAFLEFPKDGEIARDLLRQGCSLFDDVHRGVSIL